MNPYNKVTLSEPQELLLRALLRHKVVFLVIGGQAILTYTSYRKTDDLDILLSRSKINAEKVEKALQAKNWISPNGLSLAGELTQVKKLIAYPKEGYEKVADLLTSIDGIDFRHCFENSKKVIFNDLEVRVPSVKSLIEMKKVSIATKNLIARKQDEDDIYQLTKLM